MFRAIRLATRSLLFAAAELTPAFAGPTMVIDKSHAGEPIPYALLAAKPSFNDNFVKLDAWDPVKNPNGMWHLEDPWGWGVRGEGDHVLNNQAECAIDPAFEPQVPSPYSIESYADPTTPGGVNGRLHIRTAPWPKGVPVPPECAGRTYTSGFMTTAHIMTSPGGPWSKGRPNGFEMNYGLLEVFAKPSVVPGHWSAMGWSIQGYGGKEVDLTETPQGCDAQNTPKFDHQTVHDGLGHGVGIAVSSDLASGLIKREEYRDHYTLRFYINGKETWRTPNPGLYGPMSIIINTAVNGWACGADGKTAGEAVVERVTFTPALSQAGFQP